VGKGAREKWSGRHSVPLSEKFAPVNKTFTDSSAKNRATTLILRLWNTLTLQESLQRGKRINSFAPLADLA
jgi:hypothetical protein